MNNQSGAQNQSSAHGALPLNINTAASLYSSKIIIIQAVPLMRLAIGAILTEAFQVAGAQIETFATVAAASVILTSLQGGDVIIADVQAWSVLDKDRNADHVPAFQSHGTALALVTNADDNGTRLLRSRGVSGIIPPDAEPQAFVDLLKELMLGRTSFRKIAPPQALSSGLDRLSNRQFEILELMTRGLLNKQIAWELGLTEGTVKSHVSAILEKLGCDRRTQAITTFMHSVGIGRLSTAAVAA
jgi:DNA-binding NarL/FixJ family response regulator